MLLLNCCSQARKCKQMRSIQTWLLHSFCSPLCVSRDCVRCLFQVHLIPCTQSQNKQQPQQNERETLDRERDTPANSTHEFIFHIRRHRVVSHFERSLQKIYPISFIFLSHVIVPLSIGLSRTLTTKNQTWLSIELYCEIMCANKIPTMIFFHVFRSKIKTNFDICIDFPGHRNGKRKRHCDSWCHTIFIAVEGCQCKIPIEWVRKKNITINFTSKCTKCTFQKNRDATRNQKQHRKKTQKQNTYTQI